jgi:hypothetical protein
MATANIYLHEGGLFYTQKTNSPVGIWDVTTATSPIGTQLAIGQHYYNTVYTLYRMPMVFDTSSIIGIINSATLYTRISGWGEYPGNMVYIVQNGQPDYPSHPIIAGDYNRTYYSGTGATGTYSQAGGLYSAVFNSTGLSWINCTGGFTKLMVRCQLDINQSGSWPGEYNIGSVIDGNLPYLTIDYTPLSSVTITKPVAYTYSGVNVTGIITSTGGSNITTRGICYVTGTTAAIPYIIDSTAGATSSAFTTGAFNYDITGIATSNLYHIRSFVINTEGVAYSSDQVHFDIETQSSSIGLVSLTPNKKAEIKNKKEASIGINPSDPIKQRGAWKVLKLFSGYNPFPYSFSFLFSSDSDGYPLGLTSLKNPIKLTKWMSSKIGLYVDPLSMWEYVFNGVKLIIRYLETLLGVSPIQDRSLIHFIQKLSTSVGVIPDYVRNLSFIRQISTKVGTLPLIKNVGNIKRDLFTQVAVYTKGLWSGYNYCKIVTINPSTDSALSSYPMKLTIHRTTGVDTASDVYVGTDCSFDYSDIYFDTVEGVALWYWIESYTDDYAVVWIKAINIPASPTTTQIRFYYGSTIVSIRNSGVNTFTFFDDFSAGLSKWTTDSGCSIIGEELVVQSTSTATKTAYSNTSFGTNYAMRARLKSAHISGNYIEDASISDAVDGHGVGVSYCSYYSAYNNTYYNLNVDDGRTYLPVSGWVAANTYYLQDIIRNGSTDSKFYVNNLNYVSVTGVDVDSHPIRFFTTNNTAKLTIDWVLIRPWTASEPSFGIWGSKVTTADSPFKNYLLKVYDIFSTKIGLIATKYSGLGYKFSTIKLGLTSAISNAAGFIKSFTNKIGIKNEILKSLSFTRIFNLATGLVSNMHRSIEQILSTAIGFISNLGYLHAYSFIVSIGLISEHVFNRGFNKTITTVLGLIPTVGRNIYIQLSTKLGLLTTLGLIQVGRIFITALGLVATVSKVLQITRIVTTFIGLVSNFRRSSTTTLLTNLGLLATIVPKSGGRVRELLVSIGLIANYTKSMGYYLHTFIGLLSRIDKSINIQRVLQSLIAVMLVSDVRARFEELLSTLIGLVTDFDLHVGGRVRILSTSIGMVANLFRNNYWERLTVSIGIVGRLSMVGLGKSLITKLGVIATTRTNIGRALILSTVIGLVSFVHRRRYDIEVLATKLGIKASNMSSRLFGHKRFKSLKFLDRKTSDNKKLRIKK